MDNNKNETIASARIRRIAAIRKSATGNSMALAKLCKSDKYWFALDWKREREGKNPLFRTLPELVFNTAKALHEERFEGRYDVLPINYRMEKYKELSPLPYRWELRYNPDKFKDADFGCDDWRLIQHPTENNYGMRFECPGEPANSFTVTDGILFPLLKKRCNRKFAEFLETL